ncbi:MAG TPA: hypothetical protein VHX60_01295 [Acidobacteriaceae bacterium]|nr:hypothetical protein [Acidobacteriaceae bacterium]
MNRSAQILPLSALALALFASTALAQSAPTPAPAQQTQPPAQAQPAAPSQNQTSQNQTSQNQNTGVSQPPPDTTIQADEDMTTQPPPPPPPQPDAKPSAAIPAAPATASVPAPAQPAAASAPIAAAAPANPAFAGQVDNTDDGIVTVVPTPGADATLETRPADADADDGIVTSVPTDPNALAEGTNITVRLTQPLSTSETQPGTAFRSTVAHDVFNGSRLIIPAGSEMRGRVVYVSQGHHFGVRASLRLRPDVVILPDGTAYHLYADVVRSDAPGTRASDEGAIQAAPHYKKDAVEYGAGVGTGALVGGEVGGPVGAGVGSLVGAGVITTHMLLQNPQAAQLPEGSVLVFSLTEPMGLTPTKN